MSSIDRKNFFTEVIKGVCTALVISLAGVMIFALVLDLTDAPDFLIRPVNQLIKVLSVFGGCVFAVRGEKGFLKGAVIGLASSTLSALLFGLIAGGISGLPGVLVDIVCGAVMGAVSGAISVNIPWRERA